jgi:hypothetical protein
MTRDLSDIDLRDILDDEEETEEEEIELVPRLCNEIQLFDLCEIDPSRCSFRDGRFCTDIDMLRAFEGMDGVILKKAKIKTEDKLQEAQAHAANNIAELLRRVSAKSANSEALEKPFLDNSITVDDVVAGETHIGVNSETVKAEFFKST